MINVIGNEGCESPIVGAVLKQIADRHGRMRESMDEYGFQQTFGIMQRPTCGCEANTKDGQLLNYSLSLHDSSHSGHLLRYTRDLSIGTPIEQPWSLIQPQIHCDRTCVFGQEHGRPTNLWTQILDEQLAAGRDADRRQRVRVLERLALGLQSHGLSIRIQCFAQLVHLMLHVGHSGIGGERHFADELGVAGLNDFNLYHIRMNC